MLRSNVSSLNCVEARKALLAKERPTGVLPEVDSGVRSLRRLASSGSDELFLSSGVALGVTVFVDRSTAGHLSFPASPAAPPPPPTTFAVQASGGTRGRCQRGLRQHRHQPPSPDSRFLGGTENPFLRSHTVQFAATVCETSEDERTSPNDRDDIQSDRENA